MLCIYQQSMGIYNILQVAFVSLECKLYFLWNTKETLDGLETKPSLVLNSCAYLLGKMLYY